jgi:arsenate reductase
MNAYYGYFFLMITIYHNPRCSKSREALGIAEKYSAEKNIPLEVVEYLKTPLSAQQLGELQRQLSSGLSDMVRDGEPEYAALALAGADDARLLQALCDEPKLLQRPIVTYQGRAVIGRPPALVNDLLRAD